jgi:hypothetical protein
MKEHLSFVTSEQFWITFLCHESFLSVRFMKDMKDLLNSREVCYYSVKSLCFLYGIYILKLSNRFLGYETIGLFFPINSPSIATNTEIQLYSC